MARQLDALQILRGLAASLVVFDHLASVSLLRFGRHVADPRGLWFARALGMKVFFCISGHIIAQSLFSTAPGRRPLIEFYLRRVIRVVSLYWFATLLYVFAQLVQGA